MPFIVSSLFTVTAVSRQRLCFASVRWSLIILAVGALTGCETLFGKDGWFPDRSSDYLNATQSESLVLDDGSTAPSSEEYPIPDLKYANVLPDSYEVPRVNAKVDIENKGSVRIQRFNDAQWILVQRSPSETWPLILHFLNSNNVATVSQSADQGVIETEWLTLQSAERKQLFAQFDGASDETGRRNIQRGELPNERYRFALARGVQKNTTEITVIQQASDQTTSTWSTRSSSKGREDNMVNLLAEYLAGSPEQSSHSLLAQGLGSASKARLVFDEQGRPYIALELGFDRGWASVGLALDKAGFEVVDIDRSKGIYYGNYKPVNQREEKVGFFRRTYRALFDRDDGQQKSADMLITVERGQPEAITIVIQREQAPLLEPNQQAFMLRRILDKLS